MKGKNSISVTDVELPMPAYIGSSISRYIQDTVENECIVIVG